MTRNTIVSSLENKFARLKGEVRAIEKEAEEATGAELRDKILEITHRQKKIWKTMSEIESTIKIYDPGWDRERVKAIKPRKEGLPPGTISKKTLKFLSQAKTPVTTTELYKFVRAQIEAEGYVPPSPTGLRSSIHGTLERRVGKSVMKHGTTPITWSYKNQALQS